MTKKLVISFIPQNVIHKSYEYDFQPFKILCRYVMFRKILYIKVMSIIL